RWREPAAWESCSCSYANNFASDDHPDNNRGAKKSRNGIERQYLRARGELREDVAEKDQYGAPQGCAGDHHPVVGRPYQQADEVGYREADKGDGSAESRHSSGKETRR